jgi:hypothetical protein
MRLLELLSALLAEDEDGGDVLGNEVEEEEEDWG